MDSQNSNNQLLVHDREMEETPAVLAPSEWQDGPHDPSFANIDTNPYVQLRGMPVDQYIFEHTYDPFHPSLTYSMDFECGSFPQNALDFGGPPVTQGLHYDGVAQDQWASPFQGSQISPSSELSETHICPIGVDAASSSPPHVSGDRVIEQLAQDLILLRQDIQGLIEERRVEAEASKKRSTETDERFDGMQREVRRTSGTLSEVVRYIHQLAGWTPRVSRMCERVVSDCKDMIEGLERKWMMETGTEPQPGDEAS